MNRSSHVASKNNINAIFLFVSARDACIVYQRARATRVRYARVRNKVGSHSHVRKRKEEGDYSREITACSNSDRNGKRLHLEADRITAVDGINREMENKEDAGSGVKVLRSQ